jgi:hypothetical protein
MPLAHFDRRWLFCVFLFFCFGVLMVDGDKFIAHSVVGNQLPLQSTTVVLLE